MGMAHVDILPLQIVAACSLSKGQEIFNTFGELENTELVCKYGFALPNNPFNSVHLSKSVLLELAEALIGKKQLKRRREYLEEQRYVSKSTIFKLVVTMSIFCRAISAEKLPWVLWSCQIIIIPVSD